MTSFKKIAITTGDTKGIGFEVTAKALSRLSPAAKSQNTLLFLFRHQSQEKAQPKYFRLIDKKWRRRTFDSLGSALAFVGKNKSLPKNFLIDLSLESTPADWVVQAATACKNGVLTSLITGPLSKSLTSALPQKALGHTGILRLLFPERELFMSFVGKYFNVILATDHLPLSKVESQLKSTGIQSVVAAAIQFKRLIKSKKKIAILGLNPHAGEGGLIGDTERKLFSTTPKDLVGPLVPDAAFLKKNWKLYSAFICLYHDQGLIPFKMQHGQDSGVQLTLGLPFIRTSVDHGTAFELFNKNVANPNSMLEAIKLGIKLTGA